jgi:protein involved in polysaccharide export with SLBB domain
VQRLWLVLAVACGACASPRPPSYPLHPASRSASGGPVSILGAVMQPCEIPYSPGLTLRTALRFAHGPSELGMRRARITRGDRTFVVPVQAIVDGSAPDLELAPGDVVLVESARIID